MINRAQRFWDTRVETMSRDELSELQLRRLRDQMRRCRAKATFYRAKFEEASVFADDIKSFEDVALLPFVTKDDLREDQETRPPFGSFVVANEVTWREVHPSTGTTGRPVKTIWSDADVDTITDFTARTLWQFGVRPGDIVQNAFSYGLWVAGMSAHYAARKIGCLVVPTGTALSGERQIEFLSSVRATILLSTPSYALHLSERLRESGIDPGDLSLSRGGFGGEAGTENEATRAKIEQGLGVLAFDYYGLAEIGPTFGGECELKAGLHFAEDHVLVECIDPENHRPVGDGQIGVLVFTHLTREATPVLRYWSNDCARLSREPCKCGRTHVRAIGGVLGRQDDLVVFRGAKFYPSQVEKVVRSFPELSDEFRIEIVRRDVGPLVLTCTVVVEAMVEGGASFKTRVQQALRAELGVTTALRMERFGTIERTAFKAKRISVVAQSGA